MGSSGRMGTGIRYLNWLLRAAVPEAPAALMETTHNLAVIDAST
jgi:hypothetical protein